MKVAIFGVGYIGSVCCAGLVDICEEIFLVDVDQEKLDSIKNKNFKFPEPSVSQKINAANNIRTDFERKDIHACGAALLCLATEPLSNGRLDLSVVKEVVDELNTLGFSGDIIIRSTLDFDLDEISELSRVQNLFVVPEFLREGSALSDFLNGECLVVGAADGSRRSNFIENYLSRFSRQLLVTNIESAIFIKLLNNSWHALKVVFSNDWSRIAKSIPSVSAKDVYSAFCADTKLNMSPAYHRPGGPYGGPCLTKDIQAFSSLIPDGVPSMFPHVIDLNKFHIIELSDECVRTLKMRDTFKFSFNTLEFKKGTDDERHSPIIEIIKRLEAVFEAQFVSLDSDEQKVVFDGRKILDEGIVLEVDV